MGTAERWKGFRERRGPGKEDGPMVLRREAIEQRLKELRKGLRVFPRFATEVLVWLDTVEVK